ncbi:tetratricopeptide repeat protein [Nostoc sp.]|uniref:tetratricopeptide repeat protein n=1 Tax=Nostoc sp. TaxID=1180 RepID=UPI002FF4F968
MNREQQRRLEEKRDQLQQEWDLQHEKVNLIRHDLSIETDTAVKFKLKHQLPKEEAKLARLGNELDKIEAEVRSPLQTKTTTEKRLVGNQAIPEVPVWQGRDELLEELQTKLLQPENPLKVLALIGQGGIGKTSLAVKLLEALGVNCGRSALTPVEKGANVEECPYECVMYFKAQEGTSFDDVAKFLLINGLGIQTADTLKTADDKIAQIIEGLAQTRTLVVLDNLESILQPANHPQAGRAISEDWGKLLNALVYHQHQSQTLLTSREVPADLADIRYEGAEPDSELVSIERIFGVATVAGVEILRQRQLKDSVPDLRWVSERVEGHVFLLTQLAAIGKGKPGYLRKHQELVTKKAEPILREQLARQSEAARDLLSRMCVLRVGIDIRGLTFLRLYTDDWDIYFSPLIATDLPDPAELTDTKIISKTKEIVEYLVNSSLVQERYDEKKCEIFYDLHLVIVEFLKAEFKDELPNLFKIVYKFYYSGKDIENPKILEDLHPALEAQYFAFQLSRYDESLELIIDPLSKYLRRWGYWSLIIKLYEEILPYSNDFHKSLICLEIGYAYFKYGNLKIAERYFKEVLCIESNRGNNEYTANCFYLIGNIKFHIGSYDEAYDMYQKSLQLWEELDSKLNKTIIWSSLGHIENNRGNVDEAEILYKKALQLRQYLKSDEGIAISLTSLGDIELNRGHLKEAKNFYQQALEIHIQLSSRPRIAHLYCSLGYIERKHSKWNEAKSFYRQSLKLWRELGDNSGIAISIGCLGTNELGRGNLKAAEKLLKYALVKMHELGITGHIAKTNYSLAHLERKRSNTELSQQHYNTAHQIFQQLGAAKDLERIEREWELD